MYVLIAALVLLGAALALVIAGPPRQPRVRVAPLGSAAITTSAWRWKIAAATKILVRAAIVGALGAVAALYGDGGLTARWQTIAFTAAGGAFAAAVAIVQQWLDPGNTSFGPGARRR